MKSRSLLILTLFFTGLPLLGLANPAVKQSCKVLSTGQVEQLFNRWNQALQTGDPQKVTALYAQNAILLPTLSNMPRTNHQEIQNYFVGFLKKSPFGKIDGHVIRSGCNWAIDTGLYTFHFKDQDKKQHEAKARFSFTFEYMNGRWLIVSQHSSLLPNIENPEKNKAEMSQLESSH